MSIMSKIFNIVLKATARSLAKEVLEATKREKAAYIKANGVARKAAAEVVRVRAKARAEKQAERAKARAELEKRLVAEHQAAKLKSLL